MRYLIALAALAAVLVLAGPVAAGKVAASCSASPNPVAVGSTITVSATGLPDFAPNYLIVYPPTGDPFFADPYPILAGDAVSYVQAAQAGTYSFVYSGEIKTKGHFVYGTVAACSAVAQ